MNYFLTMARKQALRTTSGRWVENIIYDSMQPLESERHSTGAWNEMHEAILSWQRVFPKSEAAKIAEAGFLANHAYFQHWKQNSYSAYRQDIEKALAILAVYPTSSVGWYRLHTRVLISAGRPHEEIMISIRDSLARFPLHAQPLCDFCLMMARQGGDSAKTCADFIHLLCSYPNPEIPARVINMLHTKGLLDQVQSRIDRRDTDRILRAMAVDWKHSPSLRNELATLAVELGSRETASILLAGMQDQWSHALWKGKEDILKEVLAQAPPVEKALKLPAAQ